MATMDTGDITIPDQIFDPWLGKVLGGSTVAALSGSEPMQFGPGESMTFDIGEAEYVGEGANKGASTVTSTTKTVKPFKFHKTVRWTDEVLWADADHQLRVVSQVLSLIQPALSRALDFGVYHGINPTGGAAVTAMAEFLSQTSNSVEVAAQEPYELLDAADALVMADSYRPRDVALDTATLAASFYANRNATTLQKQHPDFTVGTELSTLEGHRASVSDTVGAAGIAATATNVQAFVGDFGAIRWGVQRQLGIELIEYGDPDGGGDLKRNNQVAYRAEVVYGWGIADLDAFAKIVDAVA